jgi:agmatinase
MISLLGIPLDENSSFLKGASGAPAKIREAFHSDSANYFSENGIDLKNTGVWKDAGDIALTGMPKSFEEITSAIHKEVAEGNKVISLGGDHSITYPIIQALAKKYTNLNILHLDAHGDLYDTFEGSKFSHACPFARIMEEKLASRLIQIGIRTFNTHQREQAKKFKVETIEMKDWVDSMEFSFTGPLYISLDLDALDPAFVPGISHYEPGGFTTRQVISVIQRLKANVVGADIVELNPNRDINNMTAMVAARFFKEIVAKMISTDGN